MKRAEMTRGASELVVINMAEGGGLLIFGHAPFEKVLFFFDVHHFGEPGERVADGAVEGFESDSIEATVADVINVVKEFFGGESDGGDG